MREWTVLVPQTCSRRRETTTQARPKLVQAAGRRARSPEQAYARTRTQLPSAPFPRHARDELRDLPSLESRRKNVFRRKKYGPSDLCPIRQKLAALRGRNKAAFSKHCAEVCPLATL